MTRIRADIGSIVEDGWRRNGSGTQRDDRKIEGLQERRITTEFICAPADHSGHMSLASEPERCSDRAERHQAFVPPDPRDEAPEAATARGTQGGPWSGAEGARRGG